MVMYGMCIRKAKKELPPEELTCPLKRDHFKKEHGLLFVFRGVCIYICLFMCIQYIYIVYM